jgi:hypothetical protein
MRLALIQIFLSAIKVAKPLNRHSRIIQQYKKGFDAENDRIIQDLGRALKKNILTVEQQRNLNRLGAAIFMGEVSDEDFGEDFRLIGKAILLKKLNDETRFLLRKVLLSDEKTAKVYLERLIYVLKIHQIKLRLRHYNSQPLSNYSFSGKNASIGKLTKPGSDDADVAELKKLLDKVLRSNINQNITTFLKNSFKTGVSTKDKYNKTLGLLEMALSYDVQKGVEYQRILGLFVESVKTGKLIEINNQEILDYINHILNSGSPLEDTTVENLAKLHLKNEISSFNHVDFSASNTVNNQKSSQALHTNSVLSHSSINNRNENQISSIANNISPGTSVSATVDQNVEKASIKTTKRAKSKKKSKRSSKSEIKSNLESHKSKDKSKKSSRKTKRLKRKTEDVKRHKSRSKNKKRQTRKFKRKLTTSVRS